MSLYGAGHNILFPLLTIKIIKKKWLECSIKIVVDDAKLTGSCTTNIVGIIYNLQISQQNLIFCFKDF